MTATYPARPSQGIYRRVTVRIWGDVKFMRLSPLQPSGQALWLYLLTGSHTAQIPGVFVLGLAALAEVLGWETEAFTKAFDEIADEGMIKFDPKTRMWFIPKAIHHNAPANANVVKSWRSQWLSLPECELRDQIHAHLAAALSEVSDAYVTAFEDTCSKTPAKASRKALRKTSPKGMPKQKQKQNQNQEEKEKKPPALSAKPTNPCPYELIVDVHHEKLPSLPKVRLMPDSRQKALRNLWGWVLSSCRSNGDPRATTAQEALTWISDYFARADCNDFLMGRTARTNAHSSWVCDLDFLLTEKGKSQVIEKTEVIS